MGSRTDMEIRPDGAGFTVFSTAHWWGADGEAGSAGGRASMTVFPTTLSAMAWAAEQFSMPPDAWRRGRGRTLDAGLGDPLPGPKAAPEMAGRTRKAGASS